MLRRLGLLIISLLAFARVVSAQTETPTAEAFPTFPVEQRCISVPTTPPKGWTYPGMILMSGYAGIHAMEADWSTPRVVAPLTMDQQGNVPIDGEQLSPDENWYAVPMGDVFIEPSLNEIWELKTLRVYSLTGDGKVLTVNLGKTIAADVTWIYFPIVWHGNQSFTVGGYSVDPFKDTIKSSDFFGFDFAPQPGVISPDLTRAFGHWVTTDDSGFGLYDVSQPADIGGLRNLDSISWQRDSAGFIAEDLEHTLVYFGRDGKQIARVYPLSGSVTGDKRPLSGRSELQWSPDDGYFGFVETFFPDSKPNNLFMVDMRKHIVINTCIAALNAPVWSPDGTMFAFLMKAPQNLNLIVVDTKTWQGYVVGQHNRTDFSQSYNGYDPEMIGWRSTAQAQ